MGREDLKVVPHFPKVQVTCDGKLIGVYGGWRKIQSTPTGYLYIKAQHISGSEKMLYVHRAVLCAWDRMPKDGEETIHIDGIKSHNHIDNLRWGTRSENNQDRVKHRVHPKVKLSDEDVMEILRLYNDKEATQVELAHMFGVTQGTISKTIRRAHNIRGWIIT